MRWSKVEDIHGKSLKETSVFKISTEQGKKSYEDLHKRVIEHVISY
jgi:hypothetical protein